MDAETVTLITDAVDYSTIITGIGTVAVAVAGVYIAMRGARMIVGMIRG